MIYQLSKVVVEHRLSGKTYCSDYYWITLHVRIVHKHSSVRVDEAQPNVSSSSQRISCFACVLFFIMKNCRHTCVFSSVFIFSISFRSPQVQLRDRTRLRWKSRPLNCVRLMGEHEKPSPTEVPNVLLQFQNTDAVIGTGCSAPTICKRIWTLICMSIWTEWHSYVCIQTHCVYKRRAATSKCQIGILTPTHAYK